MRVDMITSKKIMATSYSLDIPAEKLIEIVRKDGDTTIPLYIRLSNIKGVFNIDYDGHFGPHIYLSVEMECDDKETWDMIFTVIENYL